jgi:hypothetical protein
MDLGKFVIEDNDLVFISVAPVVLPAQANKAINMSLHNRINRHLNSIKNAPLTSMVETHRN